MEADKRTGGFFLACFAAAGALIGALGTWKAGFQSSEAGTDGAGIYTLWLAGAAGVSLLLSSISQRWDLCVIATLCGVFILGIGGFHLIDLSGQSGPLGTDPIDAGWGLWLTVFSGVGLVAGSLIVLLAGDSPTAEEGSG